MWGGNAVRGQDAEWGRRGGASQKNTESLEHDPRDSPMLCIGQAPGESGTEKRLGWTPHPRSPLFSGRDT